MSKSNGHTASMTTSCTSCSFDGITDDIHLFNEKLRE